MSLPEREGRYTPRRLNLGAGGTPLKGYENLDRKTGQEVYPLECPDNSVDEIRASHVLEHFGHGQVSEVVNHWVQKLAPGGCLKIAVPDAEKICREYLDGKPVNIQGFLMGGQVDEDDYHRCLFDEESLREVMVNAGLERLGYWVSEQQDCAALPTSLNLLGFKPASDERRVEGVAACISSARFGPSLHHRDTNRAFEMLGIPYEIQVGCFWHQILSESMERQLEKPWVEYVLTLDYDTLFSPLDVLELYRLIRAYPGVDAVCALQSKRSSYDALFTIQAAERRASGHVYTADFERNLTRISTGHFGLTLFKADSLRSHARPWMVPKPGSDGRWGSPDHVDADIDFWYRWRDAGKTLYLANRIIVGHLEEVVSWPDAANGYKPVHQAWKDYAMNGMPKELQRC